MPGSRALTVREYGIFASGAISKMFPGGSLEINSHLLPAFTDSLNSDNHALRGRLTRLCNVPVTVNSSPVRSVCAEND